MASTSLKFGSDADLDNMKVGIVSRMSWLRCVCENDRDSESLRDMRTLTLSTAKPPV